LSINQRRRRGTEETQTNAEGAEEGSQWRRALAPPLENGNNRC